MWGGEGRGANQKYIHVGGIQVSGITPHQKILYHFSFLLLQLLNMESPAGWQMEGGTSLEFTYDFTPGGVLEVYMTGGGVRRSFVLQTQKNTQA